MLKGKFLEDEYSAGMKAQGGWAVGSGTRSKVEEQRRRTTDVRKPLEQQVGLLVQIELTLNLTGR
jgi:hypothetical protein